MRKLRKPLKKRATATKVRMYAQENNINCPCC